MKTKRAEKNSEQFRASALRVGDHEFMVLSAPLPDTECMSCLTAAQREVAALLLEGQSHRAIAKTRGCAERTVANIAAAIYRKLGVHGRAELAGRFRSAADHA